MRGVSRGLGIAGVAIVLVFALSVWVNGQDASRVYDVACNGTSIRFDGPLQQHQGEDHPDYGASFVVQGYIYAEGTFAANGKDSGVLPNGDPEFPELVVGRWYCRGWFVGPEGIFTTSGPLVVTTQIYDLDPAQPGTRTLISDGLELADFDTPFRRAVTGGTGLLRGARGDVVQTVVGLNETGLFNFTFDFNGVAVQ